MLAPKCSTFNGRPTFANPMYHKKAQYDPATRLILDSEEILTLADESRSKLNKDLVKPFDYTKLNSLYEISNPAQHYENSVSTGKFTLQNLPQTAMQAVRNTNVIKPGMYRIASSTTQTRAPQLNQTFRNTNPCASTSTGVAHKTNVSRPQPRSNQMKDKIVQLIRIIDDSVHQAYDGQYLIQGNIMIKRVYYVEGLNHNLFSVGQFCDADLEVAFRKSTCFVRDLQGNDLLTGASINGKKYILVIVDDYSRYTWTLFLRSKDETPEVLKEFLTMIQRNLQAPVISVRTDRGTEFLNKTLNAFFKEEGIEHQTSTPRTPEQNGVVERRNRTLVEAARTMLSASKLPLFFWAEAIATACYTQNRSIIIPKTHEKTAYHIIIHKTLKSHTFTSLVVHVT
ncbi:retrovirus-related pol polyprotein from transposon TNT 1-94 [Tanacetum coccineum]